MLIFFPVFPIHIHFQGLIDLGIFLFQLFLRMKTLFCRMRNRGADAGTAPCKHIHNKRQPFIPFCHIKRYRIHFCAPAVQKVPGSAAHILDQRLRNLCLCHLALFLADNHRISPLRQAQPGTRIGYIDPQLVSIPFDSCDLQLRFWLIQAVDQVKGQLALWIRPLRESDLHFDMKPDTFPRQLFYSGSDQAFVYQILHASLISLC